MFTLKTSVPSILALTLVFCGTAVEAQNPKTAEFVDPDTGITFQRFFGARTSFGFGIALPENPSTDFIGQIECPIPAGAGYGGIGMTGDMEGPLLIAAWPDGEGGVISTFRRSFEDDESPPVEAGAFKISPIPEGTSSDGQSMKFTFLCENCIDVKNGFSAADTIGVVEMGWGLSSQAVSDIGNAAANMGFHDVGFGSFDASLDAARNPLFGEWAAMAGAVSNGSATPLAVSAANPLTGGGVSFDDDEGENGGGGGGGGDDDEKEGGGGGGKESGRKEEKDDD